MPIVSADQWWLQWPRRAGAFRRGPSDKKLAGDDAPVVIIGLGPTGRAVGDALCYNEIGYLSVEPDPLRFETALADGNHVHHANPADPRSGDALGMGKREVVAVAAGNISISRDLSPLVQERLPNIARVIALSGAEALEEFIDLGMVPVDVKAPHGTERVIEMVFQSLERERKLPVSSLSEEDRALEYA